MDRNCPPSANQVICIDEPRCSHVVCTLQVHPPTSPYPALSTEVEPISKGHCWKWHHAPESLMMLVGAMGPNMSWLANGVQSHPPMERTIASWLITIFMAYTIRLTVVFVGDTVRIRLDRGSVLSSALAWTSVPHFHFCSPLLKILWVKMPIQARVGLRESPVL